MLFRPHAKPYTKCYEECSFEMEDGDGLISGFSVNAVCLWGVAHDMYLHFWSLKIYV
jgi:hypothetical protein